MDLKNAVAVCLISLFSATIVVLIARTLDSQAAARLEPALLRIAGELEAIRKQGSAPVVRRESTISSELGNRLIVYYFHSNTRCPSCRAIESQTRSVLENEFGRELSAGTIRWEIVNYESSAAAEMAKTFDIQVPVVVLVDVRDGKIARWKRLDEVWGLYDERERFADFMRREIRTMLAQMQDGSSVSADDPSTASAEPAKENGSNRPSPPPPVIPIPGQELPTSPPVPRIPIPE